MTDNIIIYICKICGKKFKSKRGIATHVTTIHDNVITPQEYYDKYLKTDCNEGFCKTCNKPTKFLSINKGYKKYCNPHCQMTDLTRKDEYRNRNPFCQEGQQYIKQKILEKFGVSNPCKLKSVSSKISKTKLNYTQEQNDKINEKRYNTNIKKYGVKLPAQLKEIQEKIQQTNLKRRGVKCSFQSDECKEKIKQTWCKNLGVDNPSKSEIVKNKRNSTKKKNHTFNASITEELFANYLIENNYHFSRQYKSALYPFNCDFYLNDYDLYIEINAFWGHGGHPFDNTNIQDIKTLNEWKSRNTAFYNSAIETWTVRDVNKLKIAKQNNLNYLPIYSNNINKIIFQFENYIKNKKF